MKPETVHLLNRVRDSTANGDQSTLSTIESALMKIAELTSEAYSIMVDYQNMEFSEDDDNIRGALGEYEQKFGALERTGKELRDKWKRMRRILNEIKSLDDRLGKPLRETGEIPVVVERSP